MRPFTSHSDQGAEAWLSGRDESANPYREGSLAHIEWLSGHLATIAESGDLDGDSADSAKIYAEEVRGEARRAASRLMLDVPTATAVGDAIGIPVKRWPGNCFAISVAALESGVLDEFQEKHGRLFPAYGMYDGPMGSGQRGMNRHGWLESNEGHVVDPTRWVFTQEYPHIWAGTLDDYDLGGMRLRSGVRPSSAPKPMGEQVRLGVNDPSLLAAFDRLLGDHSTSTTGAIHNNRLHWIATTPLEKLGDDAEAIMKTIDRIGRSSLIPVDNRLWIEFSTNGYSPEKLRPQRDEVADDHFTYTP